MLLILCYINIVSTLSSSNSECYDAWECQSQELSGNILCYGYQSCEFSTITSSYYIPCVGYKSCINSKITSTNTIACYGDYGCSNAQLSSPGIFMYTNLSIRRQQTRAQPSHQPIECNFKPQIELISYCGSILCPYVIFLLYR